MHTSLSYLLLAVVLLAPFALLAGLAKWSPRIDSAPARFADDADMRRIDHEVDAIRTRFDSQLR